MDPRGKGVPDGIHLADDLSLTRLSSSRGDNVQGEGQIKKDDYVTIRFQVRAKN